MMIGGMDNGCFRVAMKPELFGEFVKDIKENHDPRIASLFMDLLAGDKYALEALEYSLAHHENKPVLVQKACEGKLHQDERMVLKMFMDYACDWLRERKADVNDYSVIIPWAETGWLWHNLVCDIRMGKGMAVIGEQVSKLSMWGYEFNEGD